MKLEQKGSRDSMTEFHLDWHLYNLLKITVLSNRSVVCV